MINWPHSLVREVSSRRCIFFLGSGVSASAKDDQGKSPPTWSEFLKAAARLTARHKRTAINKLINNNKFLIALEAIQAESDSGDYRELLNAYFNNPRYKASDLHKHINALDPRIVITTNFDKIYEEYCREGSEDAYKTIEYTSEDLSTEIRSDTRLIIKAHGSINAITRMIFTKSEYHKAKRDYPEFYEILKALFITNTVIFVGCGLEDPDLLLLLEEVKLTAESDKPHYAVVKKGQHVKYAVSDLKKTYNVQVLEYGPSHDNLVIDMGNLLEQVNTQRSQNPVV